jgi:fructoselysine-6-P-deglycase FrlB-like protein/hydroxymethylpyrimidine pyrophosphatase-like HAD family hydrolase
MTTRTDELVTAIAAASRFPLLATGSGGSLTAAHFAAELHQRQTGMISKGTTPLELISSPLTGKDQAVLFVSAGGRNSDIIAAFKSAVALEPKRLIVICSRAKSPLSQLAEQHRYVDLIELNIPAGKDGFLATNSLLAFAVVIARSWAAASGIENPLPTQFNGLICPQKSIKAFSAELADRCAPLWRRETLSVLYGPSTRAAAIDLESKFTEAALGSVQIADYRNFAHGRHHWLAKRGQSTGVLAFVADDDRATAKRTLSLIPADIPLVRIDIPSSRETAALSALLTTLYIVGLAGAAKGVDPGRPGVPSFGSKIYHLPAFRLARAKTKGLTSAELVAIERKSGSVIDQLASAGELQFWRQAYRSFLGRLRKSSFGGIVLDYDGTLCDGRNRFTGIGDDVAAELIRLLRSRVVVGIATGRGKSVREDFRRCIPDGLWDRFLVGYYNGADVGLLSDDACPDGFEAPDQELQSIAEALKSSNRVTHLAKCEYRRKQISIVPKTYTSFSTLWKIVEQIVQEIGTPGVTAVSSSHSLDVLAPGITKKAIVQRAKGLIHGSKTLPVLCIGDRGQWPGNDFALLKYPSSLSCDEVSLDPDTCWNLAPAGHRGVQATLDYLRAIDCKDGSFKLSP